MASKYSHLSFLSYLAENEMYSNVNFKNKNGNTALIESALTKNGFENQKDKLMKCQNYLCFQYLLSLNGIDKNIKNNDGLTAIDICKKEGKTQFL